MTGRDLKWSEHLRATPGSEQYEGIELGDPLNDDYVAACKEGRYDTVPDCGHTTCGLLCDHLIRHVRRRRAEAGHQGRVS